jgi:hypothetical protein
MFWFLYYGYTPFNNINQIFRWGMTNGMHDIIFDSISQILLCMGLIFFGECKWSHYNWWSTMVHVHVYAILKCWHQIPIWLTLECVKVSAHVNNIIANLLKCMAKYGRTLNEQLDPMWVCFGCDEDCCKDITLG